MKRSTLLAFALSTAVSMAMAAEAVTTEKSETKEVTGAGTHSKTTTKVTSTEYVNQMRTVYTSAGIPATKAEQLAALDKQLYDAYLAGNVSEVRRIRVEIRTLLGEDVTRVYSYVEAHPLPSAYPDFIVNTYAPEASFTRDITISGPGIAGTASNVDVNVNRTGSTASHVTGSTTKAGTNTAATDTKMSGSSTSDKTAVGGAAQGTVSGSGSVSGSGTVSGSTSPSGTSANTSTDTNMGASSNSSTSPNNSSATDSNAGATGSSSTGAAGSNSSASGSTNTNK